MEILRRLRPVLVVAAAAVLAMGCSPEDGSSGDTASDGSAPPPETEQGAEYPDVIEAEVTSDGEVFTVSATISSPYDSEDRYADAFRVLGPGGEELGVRELTHPHAEEQPFTRRLDGVEIPDEVDSVTVEGRDLVNGWGGDTVEVAVPGR